MFDIALEAKAISMQQLATYVANDPRIALLFQKGRQAVQEEGGGPGREKAAVTRRKLFQMVIPSWKIMTSRYDVRQLHFHLGPGSTSFLRVHRPDKFGDNMDSVRYTVVDANRNKAPTKGFETGRVYSGIRGVVPVLVDHPNRDEKEHVGALEAGTSFTVLIESLKKELDGEICILLTKNHVNKNMWQDFIENHFTPDKRHDDFFIESTTSNDIKNILKMEKVNSVINSNDSIFVKEPHPLQFCFFPLRDYRGSIQQDLPSSGRVVVWKAADKRWNLFKKNLINNIGYAFLALMIVETVLFIAWKYSIKKLNSIINRQTEEINKNYERLERLINSLPSGILVVDQETEEILEVNPEAADLIGMPREKILSRALTDFIRTDRSGPESGEGEGDISGSRESYLKTGNGEEKPVLKIDINTEIHDKDIKIISFVDYSEQKEAQNEKIQRERLNGVLETAGAICHELNQPLMSVSGYAELLMLDLPEDETTYETLKKIRRQIGRMGEITRKLMSITRYQTKTYLDGKIIDLDGASETGSRSDSVHDEGGNGLE